MSGSFRVTVSRLGAFFTRKRQDAELSAELAEHLTLLTQEFIRQGMLPDDAHFAALRKLGRPLQIAETNRELRGVPMIEAIVQDLRYSIRTLRRSLGFSALVILIFALAIGGSSALFTLLARTLISGLPFSGAKNIVVIWRERLGRGPGQGLLSPAEYLAYRQSARSLVSLSALEPMTAVLATEQNPTPMPAVRVTPEIFQTLGIEPQLGRTFAESDSRGDAAQVALISEGYWRAHFASDSAILGKTIDLQLSSMHRDVNAADGTFVVVGVLPAGLPFAGLTPLNADIWIPVPAAGMAANHSFTDFFAIGRLKSSRDLPAVQSELDATAADLRRQFPQTNADWGIRATPLRQQVYGDLEGSLGILGVAIGLVLLIACANVAHLDFAHAAAREKEFAIRGALGASRMRQVRQMLIEGMLLALAGGAFGVLLGEWSLKLLASGKLAVVTPGSLHVEFGAMGATFALALIAGVASALLPALKVTRESTGAGATDSFARKISRHPRLNGRRALIASELAVAAALLCCAGLLMKSFYKLTNVPLGFSPRNALTMRISLPSAAYATPERREQFYRQVISQVEALPGVEAAGVINLPPLIGRDAGIPFAPEGADAAVMRGVPAAGFRAVSPDYFRAMGLTLLAGRTFSEIDLEHTRLIVNEAFAREWWPRGDAIGKRVKLTPFAEPSPYVIIVGVVSDVRQFGLATPDRPAIYLPLMEEPAMSLVVRTQARPETLADAVRGAVRQVDPLAGGGAISYMPDTVANSLAQPRLRTLILVIFAALGLLLAAIGVYGVIAFYVARRRKEIGVRMAIGAQAGDVVSMILREGMQPAAAGAALGVLFSVAFARLLAAFLFGTSPLDAGVLTLAPATVLAVTGIACLAPALRAAHADPLATLRHD